MILGLVSTYREGALALDAVRSLEACCDAVRVLDGPIGEPTTAGTGTDWSVYSQSQTVVVGTGGYPTDAAKRTALLHRAQKYPPPVWGVILDGDEILVWGEYLRSQIEHMSERERETGVIQTGCSLRLVESDGSVAQINARVLRLDLVDSYVHSSYHLRWKNGTESARPNFPLRLAGEADMPPHRQVIDELTEADEYPELRDLLETELAQGFIQRRRPLHGEPHILHRSILRAGSRSAIPRMHVIEHEGLAGTLKVPVETGEGIPAWTP